MDRIDLQVFSTFIHQNGMDKRRTERRLIINKTWICVSMQQVGKNTGSVVGVKNWLPPISNWTWVAFWFWHGRDHAKRMQIAFFQDKLVNCRPCTCLIQSLLFFWDQPGVKDSPCQSSILNFSTVEGVYRILHLHTFLMHIGWLHYSMESQL